MKSTEDLHAMMRRIRTHLQDRTFGPFKVARDLLDDASASRLGMRGEMPCPPRSPSRPKRVRDDDDNDNNDHTSTPSKVKKRRMNIGKGKSRMQSNYESSVPETEPDDDDLD
jgi:hypothetical protein